MNEAFCVYRDMYYEKGAISSVYLWDLDDGFAGTVLLKKRNFYDNVVTIYIMSGVGLDKQDTDEDQETGDSTSPEPVEVEQPATTEIKGMYVAGWDSMHVFEASDRSRQATYKVTSSLFVHLVSRAYPHMVLSGYTSKQNIYEGIPCDDFSTHAANIGRIVEDIEGKMRAAYQDVSFARCRDIVQELRQLGGGLREKQRQRGIQQELVGLLRMRKPMGAATSTEPPESL